MKPRCTNPDILVREALTSGQELRREFELDRAAVDEQARTVALSFSSEAAVERYFGIEILDHATGSIRLGRMENGAALLVNHDRGDQVGVVESVTIGQDRRGRAVVRFGRSARANEIFQDVVDGIRRLVSVGYRVHRTETTQTGGVETVRVVDWEPFEISLVSIPADDSVGVGRGESEPSRGPNNNSPTTHVNRAQIIAALRAANIAFRDEMTDDELRALLPANTQPAPAPAAQRQADPAPAPAPASVVVTREAPPAPSVQDAIAAERQRVAGINALADQMRSNGVIVDASRALGDGSNVEAFRAVAFEALLTQRNTSYSPGLPGPSRGEVRDMDRFDLAVALRSMAEGTPLTGIERELLQEGVHEARAAGIQNPGTLMLPSMFVRRGQRDLTATGTTSVAGDQGGMTVQTNRVGLLDDFFNASVIRQLGATVLTGLVGNLELPRLVAGTAPTKKAENASADEVTPTTANLALTPKRLPAFIDISQQLLMQSSVAIESMIRMHLTNQMLAVQEAAFFHGGGTSEANGIAGTSGIGSVAGGTNGAAPTYAHLIALESAIDTQNALGGSLRYATNGQIRAKLKQTPKQASGVEGNFILTDLAPNMLNGYRSEFTNAISRTLTKGSANAVASAIFFGNFVDYIVGYWGGLSLELIRDSANAKLGMYTLVANTYYDGGVVRPKSFAAMLDALGA
ncbi:phage major capsid protein [Luteolibacter arcticus]|uniref:Phage major capsid protein n=1 Tax=Luteolibacter arcticus TaxID=1581411 RepID=A0ABT3GCF9_9BACT|nr:phage major capsid protein [Luteolibacter arcticus]MCW1921310.1 phage major capsid protein [Luteolibacter arcticus]